MAKVVSYEKSRMKTSYRSTTGSETVNRNRLQGSSSYVSGNVAYDYETSPLKRELEEPVKKLSKQTARNRAKARHMNLGYVAFLTLAMGLMAASLFFYIQLQSEITSNVKTISKLERQLNSVRMENDEAYARANGNVDLEEIKRIAIGELGMTYATEGQIVTYSGGGSDYVKQVADIPGNN